MLQMAIMEIKQIKTSLLKKMVIQMITNKLFHMDKDMRMRHKPPRIKDKLEKDNLSLLIHKINNISY